MLQVVGCKKKKNLFIFIFKKWGNKTKFSFEQKKERSMGVCFRPAGLR